VVQLNGIEAEDVASAIFTTTRDLNAEFPALAARQFGWLEVPLLCSHEIEVPGALAQCIRILIFWNTEKLQGDVQHVYVRGAESLRPDMK
jgi:chorismate mutase